MVGRAMKIYVVVMLHKREDFIPCAWIFGFLHPQDVHDHPIDHLCLTINLGMEGSGFGELGVQ